VLRSSSLEQWAKSVRAKGKMRKERHQIEPNCLQAGIAVSFDPYDEKFNRFGIPKIGVQTQVTSKGHGR
jgi:hypothetical protein